MNLKLLFIVKGGRDFGMGHLMRSATLFAYLVTKGALGDGVCFLTNDDPIAIQFLKEKDIPFKIYSSSYLTEYLTDYHYLKADIIIIDCLEMSQEELCLVRSMGDKMICFDDTGLISDYADVVINGQYLNNDRKQRRNQRAQYFVGPQYMVMRDSFRLFHEKERIYNPIGGRILICIGGAGYWESLHTIIQSLAKVPVREILALTGYTPSYDFLSRLVWERMETRVQVVEKAEEMAPLLYDCDLAVIAGGFLKYEAAAVGTPSVILSFVDHQHHLAKEFERYGCAVYMGRYTECSGDSLFKTVEELLFSKEKREKMGKRGKALVDGRGLERVSDIILSIL